MSREAKPSATWTRTTVEVAAAGSSDPVPAYVSDATPGLAVTQIGYGGPDSEARDSPIYSVTHIASGRSIGGVAYLFPAAQAVALELAPLGDWTRDYAAVRADAKLRKAATRIVEKRHPRSAR